jgi:uncharacterized protein YbjT (DUF2867 family)
MAVKTVRRGLNRETRALLEYVRRMVPVNTACGLPEQVAVSKAHMAVDRVIAASGMDHSMVEELRWMVEDVARARLRAISQQSTCGGSTPPRPQFCRPPLGPEAAYLVAFADTARDTL